MFDAFVVCFSIVFGYRIGEILATSKIKFATLVLLVLAIKFVMVLYGS